jgi:hypothetical protein
VANKRDRQKQKQKQEAEEGLKHAAMLVLTGPQMALQHEALAAAAASSNCNDISAQDLLEAGSSRAEMTLQQKLEAAYTTISTLQRENSSLKKALETSKQELRCIARSAKRACSAFVVQEEEPQAAPQVKEVGAAAAAATGASVGPRRTPVYSDEGARKLNEKLTYLMNPEFAANLWKQKQAHHRKKKNSDTNPSRFVCPNSDCIVKMKNPGKSYLRLNEVQNHVFEVCDKKTQGKCPTCHRIFTTHRSAKTHFERNHMVELNMIPLNERDAFFDNMHVPIPPNDDDEMP